MPTDRFGICDRYHDAQGAEHITTNETRAALRRAMGVSQADEPRGAADERSSDEGSGTESGRACAARDGSAGDAVCVLQPGGDRALAQPVEIALEDGSTRVADGELPGDLPLGYHRMRARDGRESLLIVAPAACHLPEDLRTWGWAAQVYATRSRASWGMGDLADLARLGRWTRSLGAGCIMINPLSAPTPVPLIEPSPYYPSSRRYRNPLFLRVEDVPGFEGLGEPGARLANAGRALNQDRRIDRDAVFRLKMEALQALFARFAGDAAFDAYLATQRAALTEFATYCALAERHGKDWRRWPAEVRRPDGSGARAFATEQAPRVRFHAWLQWLLDLQLAGAAREIALINDLPIGIDVAGADAWCWQDLMAADVSVGAPPDEFSANGQDWGLAPFVPHKLRAAGYGPFVETIRSMLTHAGGLRIDHVMGLFRLFWIPRSSGLGAKGGTYVRSRAHELLAIVALESVRARAFIVGEDLGTVEDGVREMLAARRLLSYRLFYFEPTPPREFPELALTSVTTHDLATIAGLWTGSDVADQKRIGLSPNEPGMRALRDKMAREADIPVDAPAEVAIERTYAALAEAPSRVLLATLDDALAVSERPNMPGTVTEWPNWSLSLPLTLDDIEEAPLPRKLAATLKR
ncbi:MAG TPA: 4-alpha-glucanotransferase [Polyangia bacterium]|jgi:4-alpha-glucanotransferase|nr:4-alpha-glucanotransferase [Polyangia bacterium]